MTQIDEQEVITPTQLKELNVWLKGKVQEWKNDYHRTVELIVKYKKDHPPKTRYYPRSSNEAWAIYSLNCKQRKEVTKFLKTFVPILRALQVFEEHRKLSKNSHDSLSKAMKLLGEAYKRYELTTNWHDHLTILVKQFLNQEHEKTAALACHFELLDTWQLTIQVKHPRIVNEEQMIRALESAILQLKNKSNAGVLVQDAREFRYSVSKFSRNV